MSEKERIAEHAGQEREAVARKPYEAPAWEVEEAEAEAALSCAQADDVTCAGGPLVS